MIVEERAKTIAHCPPPVPQKGTLVDVKGMPFTFVPVDQEHKPSDAHPWQHLRMVPVGHTKLTKSLQSALGITDCDLRAVLDLEAIQQQVIRCPVVNLPKLMHSSRTSGWRYTIRHNAEGDEVIVGIQVGLYAPPPGTFSGLKSHR